MAKQQISMRPMTRDAVEILGSQIREARVRRGWTQAQTADRLRISVGTYAAIERGAGSTSIAHVFNAAELLGIPLFAAAADDVSRLRSTRAHIDALIPKRVVSKEVEIDDDF